MAKKHHSKKHAEKHADHHPHFAGVRHAGMKVGEEGRGGPQPGPHEFSADQEMAMRDKSGAPAFGQEGSASEEAAEGEME